MSHYRNFTPPFEIPDSWEWVRLDEIATSNIGLTYSPQDIVEDGVPVYRSNNIKDNKICLDEIVYVSCHILEKQYLHNGDLLICARNGSRRLVGKNIIIENLERPTSFGAFMAVCRSCYNPWIKLLLDSAYFNSYLDESNSTAINQITQKMLLDFVLPFPPQKEQSRINAAFQSIECIIDIIEQRESELKTGITNLKYRILDLAMQGKLVPQDPTDEPAADMLRRINPKAKIITDNPHYPQLPDNWVLIKLGEVVKVINGKNQREVENPSGTYPIYGSGGIIGMADNYSCLSGSTIIGRKGTINNPLFIETNFWNVDTAFGMKPCEAVKDLYFYHFCKSFDFKSLDKSSTLPSLTKSAIEDITMPIPPLNEQDRIIFKIKEYDKLSQDFLSQLD